MGRWRQRYEEHDNDALFDRRWGKPSPKRVPLEVAWFILTLPGLAVDCAKRSSAACPPVASGNR